MTPLKSIACVLSGVDCLETTTNRPDYSNNLTSLHLSFDSGYASPVTLTIPGADPVAAQLVIGMSVTLGITHPSVQDLQIFLQYPGVSCSLDPTTGYISAPGCARLVSSESGVSGADLDGTVIYSTVDYCTNSISSLNSSVAGHIGNFFAAGSSDPLTGRYYGTHGLIPPSSLKGISSSNGSVLGDYNLLVSGWTQVAFTRLGLSLSYFFA
jgi:hypothetical protein